MSHQTYTKEFKLETLNLAEEIGPTQAARRLNVSVSIIYRWRKEFKESGEEAFRGHGVMTAQDAELARLRREVVDLKEDKEILKKALEIFSQKKVRRG